MSVECGECECDLHGAHDPSCSRWERCKRRVDAAPLRSQRCRLVSGHGGECEWRLKQAEARHFGNDSREED